MQIIGLPEEETFYCIKCGRPVKSSWDFCPRCGTPVHAEELVDPSIEAEAREKMLTAEQVKAIRQMQRENAQLLAEWKAQKEQKTSGSIPVKGVSEKKPSLPKSAFLGIFIVGSIALLLLIAALKSDYKSNPLTGTSGTAATAASEQTSAPKPTAKPKATPTPAAKATPTPKPVNVYNGQIYKKTTYKGVCPLTVSVPSGKNDYYIYLKYLKAPTNTTENRKYSTSAYSGTSNKSEPDISFFVHAGNSVTVQVPIGIYQLYYACGETWFGEKIRFGTAGVSYTSPDLLTFNTIDKGDMRYYNGHTLELWLQTNGNFDSDVIPDSEFPE